MSCSPCTTCEECKTVTAKWPGCGVSTYAIPGTDPVEYYSFSIDIPVYYLNEITNTLYPVQIGDAVFVLFTKKSGASMTQQIPITVEGILTIDGTESWYSSGFFNGEAGPIEMEIYTGEGVRLLQVAFEACSTTVFQCADCTLINFTSGTLPLSTVPFQFNCDFVQCEYPIDVCVPGCFYVVGPLAGIVPEVIVYLRNFTELQLYTGIPPGTLLPLADRQAYVRDGDCYTPLTEYSDPLAIGTLCNYFIEDYHFTTCA